MSDAPMGPGWMMAQDGKWYPPPEQKKKPSGGAIAATIVVTLIVIFVAISALGASSKKSTISATPPSTERIAALTTLTTAAPVVTDAPAPTVAAGPQVVLNFAGVAEGSSEDFTVGKKWELSWTVVGGAGIAVEILDGSNKSIDRISVDPGSAKSLQRVPCEACHLKVSTYGAKSYVVLVTNLP